MPKVFVLTEDLTDICENCNDYIPERILGVFEDIETAKEYKNTQVNSSNTIYLWAYDTDTPDKAYWKPI